MRKTKGFAILDRTLLPFWAFFARLFAPRWNLCLRNTNARIQFLIAQTRIFRSRIDASRIVPTPEEKEELLRWGASFDHKIDGVMEVVKPATYRKWLRMRKGIRTTARRPERACMTALMGFRLVVNLQPSTPAAGRVNKYLRLIPETQRITLDGTKGRPHERPNGKSRFT